MHVLYLISIKTKLVDLPFSSYQYLTICINYFYYTLYQCIQQLQIPWPHHQPLQLKNPLRKVSSIHTVYRLSNDALIISTCSCHRVKKSKIPNFHFNQTIVDLPFSSLSEISKSNARNNWHLLSLLHPQPFFFTHPV